MKRLLGMLVLGVIVFVSMTAVCFAVDNTGTVAVDQQEQFGGIVVGVVNRSAVVQDIDYITRMVALKYDNGDTESFIAGPEVRNFNQVNKGDKVNINYAAAVTLLIGGPAQPLQREEAVEIELAPLGQKPAETIKAVTDISAVIEEIDYVNRLVTVKGPQRTLTVKIDPQEKNLEKIKKGDEVFLRINEALTINVTP